MKLSEYCRQKRESTGLNVLAYSKKLGCSHSYILKIESGDYDAPTSLIVAKIILKYDLDVEDFKNIDGINYSEDFVEDVERHLNRNIGTKMVTNTKNIIEKLRNDCLLPNGYKDIRQATTHHGIDYVCQKDDRAILVKVIDVRSTIAVKVDKEKIYNYIMQLIGEISCGYFEIKGVDKFDVLLVTPSEKVYKCARAIVSNINAGKHLNYRIDIALVRPKRPIIEPKIINK